MWETARGPKEEKERGGVWVRRGSREERMKENSRKRKKGCRTTVGN